MSELGYAIYLLEAALEADRKRPWWRRPNRLWVGRTEHALSILRRIEARP
jgi:hypothetical protein